MNQIYRQQNDIPYQSHTPNLPQEIIPSQPRMNPTETIDLPPPDDYNHLPSPPLQNNQNNQPIQTNQNIQNDSMTIDMKQTREIDHISQQQSTSSTTTKQQNQQISSSKQPKKPLQSSTKAPKASKGPIQTIQKQKQIEQKEQKHQMEKQPQNPSSTRQQQMPSTKQANKYPKVSQYQSNQLPSLKQKQTNLEPWPVPQYSEISKQKHSLTHHNQTQQNDNPAEQLDNLIGITSREDIEHKLEKRISDLLFDSDVNNWDSNSKDFSDRLHRKRNILIFVYTQMSIKWGIWTIY